MAKHKILKSSPEGTPEEEIIYVLELPATSRVKFRKVDLEKEIVQLADEVSKKQARKLEVEDLLAEVNKI